MEDIQLVKEFLPTRGTGAVLLTTRLYAVGTHIRKIELNTMTLEEGITFFRMRVGTGEEPEQKNFSERERQDAEQLYTLLGGFAADDPPTGAGGYSGTSKCSRNSAVGPARRAPGQSRLS